MTSLTFYGGIGEFIIFPQYIDIITVYGYNEIRGVGMYSVREASTKLGISERHVRLLLKRGDIAGKKLGRDWVVLDLNYTRKRKPKGGKK